MLLVIFRVLTDPNSFECVVFCLITSIIFFTSFYLYFLNGEQQLVDYQRQLLLLVPFHSTYLLHYSIILGKH
jgi:hypothetical protein